MHAESVDYRNPHFATRAIFDCEISLHLSTTSWASAWRSVLALRLLSLIFFTAHLVSTTCSYHAVESD